MHQPADHQTRPEETADDVTWSTLVVAGALVAALLATMMLSALRFMNAQTPGDPSGCDGRGDCAVELNDAIQ